MKKSIITSILALWLSGCGGTSGNLTDPELTSDGDTRCKAPDYTVNEGEMCDETLKDCGNAICASPLVCMNAICVNVTDAGVDFNE